MTVSEKIQASSAFRNRRRSKFHWILTGDCFFLLIRFIILLPRIHILTLVHLNLPVITFCDNLIEINIKVESANIYIAYSRSVLVGWLMVLFFKITILTMSIIAVGMVMLVRDFGPYGTIFMAMLWIFPRSWWVIY